MVALVERGYSENIYEFTNDLAPRTFCERRLPDFAEDQRERLESLDARFMASTAPTARPTHGAEGWWWWRLPSPLEGELLADAEQLELMVRTREASR